MMCIFVVGRIFSFSHKNSDSSPRQWLLPICGLFFWDPNIRTRPSPPPNPPPAQFRGFPRFQIFLAKHWHHTEFFRAASSPCSTLKLSGGPLRLKFSSDDFPGVRYVQSRLSAISTNVIFSSNIPFSKQNVVPKKYTTTPPQCAVGKFHQLNILFPLSHRIYLPQTDRWADGFFEEGRGGSPGPANARGVLEACSMQGPLFKLFIFPSPRTFVPPPKKRAFGRRILGGGFLRREGVDGEWVEGRRAPS